MLNRLAFILFSVFIGGLRVTGEKGEAFQAVAHFFMGGLFTSLFFVRKRTLPLVVFVVLCVLELACFFGFHISL
jgi:hypothetical protein